VPVDPKTLPQDPETLQKMLVDVTAQLDRTERLLRQLLAAKTGRKSEQLSPEQFALFAAEAGIPQEELSEKQEDEDDQDPSAPTGGSSGRTPHGRRPLAPHLKRQRIEHDLAENEKHCHACAQDLRPIGEESSERYEYLPAQMLVIEDVCKKYACACTIKTASKPSQPIEKSSAGASLLTQVIVAKYADHLPLHRQAKIFRRCGIELSDQTMCGWVEQCAALLEPLYERLKKFVLASKVVGTDDTPVKVLDRSLPHARKGRIWPYVGDREHTAAIYDYTPTRERAGPERFLKDYRGHLQADAYPAYDSFFTDPTRELVEVGCWAHARRHFYQAQDNDPSRMRTVLLLIAQLYQVEKVGRERGLRGEELLLLREHGARPLLEKIHAYLQEIREALLPKSEAGQAVAYALKNWTALQRYCGNPDLAIDNNATERSLRCFAVGRNNWTFFGSDRGGRTAAVLRSFVTSCELVKIDPFSWFRDVLARIADHPVTRLDELLPHRWIPAVSAQS
jgi:transposase